MTVPGLAQLQITTHRSDTAAAPDVAPAGAVATLTRPDFLPTYFPPAPSPPPSPAPVSQVPSRPPRLGPGDLRRLVAAHLAATPGIASTPREIAAALVGRSPGAVLNALEVLVSHNAAVKVTVKPARYAATATTAHAAISPTSTTRAPSTPTLPAPGAPVSGAPIGATPRTPLPGPGVRRSSPPRSPHPGTRPVSGSGAAPMVEEVMSGPVARPNGQTYHPRLLAGLPDVTVLRKLRAAGVSALLYGPPGTGKTSVVEAAFPDLITIPGDGDTVVADFVGEYTQTSDGRYVFVHGPLVRAMREGRALFVDDATVIPPSVLAVLYPAMDGRREVVVKANGGEIACAAPGFYVIAGHNPGVQGAHLSEALSSRFSMQIKVTTDYDLAAHLKIDKRAERVARNLATRLDRGEVGWALQLRELLAFQRIAEVLGVAAAAGNLIGCAPEDDRAIVASVVRDVFGAAHTPLALGARITPSTPPATPPATSTARPATAPS